MIDAAIARHQQSRHNISRFVDALGTGVMEVEKLSTADLNRDLVATCHCCVWRTGFMITDLISERS